MAARFCPNCGAPLEFTVQKFCTTCGATLPDVPPAPAPAAAAAPSGFALPLIAGAVVLLLILGAGAYFLLPNLTKAGPPTGAGTAAGDASGGSLTGGDLPGQAGMTTITTPPTVVTTARTTAVTTLPTTVVTTTVPVTTPSPAPTPATTAPTPVPEQTTVITAQVTRVPEQPPVSSYTSSTPGAPYIDPGALEARVHELVNVQRQNNGLQILTYDSFLADIARGHSWDMVRNNYFEHINMAGLDPRGRGDWAGYPCTRVFGLTTYFGITENLYQGHRASSYYTNAEGVITSYNWRTLDEIAQVCVNGWMESPGHRKNILTPHLSYEGIGVAFGTDDKVYITQNFC